MPDLNLDVIDLQLPCDRHAPGAVRGALNDRSSQTNCGLGDVTLIASELVTNAVLHSECSEQDSIQVRVRFGAECLSVSVTDPGCSGRDAEIREGASFGGWGLQLVEQLTLRWGSQRTAGYNVWAELPLPA